MRAAHLRCAALLVLLGACGTALGLRIQAAEESAQAAEESTQAAEESNAFLHLSMKRLGEKIRFRFAQVDADKDGMVTFEEMKRGFGHAPLTAGEDILRSMLAVCAGGDREATSCTRKQMDRTLQDWFGSQAAKNSLALIQADSQSGFRAVAKKVVEVTPCGPSAGTPDAGLEGVKCTQHGPQCFKTDNLVAWALTAICRDITCICEATTETKRLAKLGLLGAAGVTTAHNFSDPSDELLAPSCGDGWEMFKVVGTVENLDSHMSFIEKAFVRKAMPLISPNAVKDLDSVIDMDTEVALYKSAHHRLSKNGAHGKVCMMSWQATRSSGDWKANLMLMPIQFPYRKPGMTMMVPKGLVIGYESVRDKLKRKFEQECCSDDFRADKVIISGHSRGATLAQLHAMDMVSNWECPRGRDLGAKDIAVVMVAPQPQIFDHSVVNQIWSCNNAASCLAGSAIAITTKSDHVGDSLSGMQTYGTLGHPSEVARVPCPPRLEEANYNNSVELFKEHWCHGMYNYIPMVEQALVGEAGWGSSCDGACGDPNRMVQCNLWVIMGATGCSYADPQWLKPPTECPSSQWLPQEERCDCHFDLCTELTKHGCQS